MRVPLASPAVAVVAGVTLGWTHPGLADSVARLVVLGALAAAVGACSGRAQRPFVAACLAGFLSVGYVLGSMAAAKVEDVETGWRSRDAADGDRSGPVVVAGRLIRDATRTDYGASLSLAVDHVETRAGTTPVHGGLRASVGGVFVDDRLPAWRAGRRLRLPVTLRPAPRFLNPGTGDRRRALAERGVFRLGSVKSALLVEVIAPASLWAEMAADIRASVRRRVERTVGAYGRRSAAVVTAVLIGDRTGLDDETERRLQEAGTFHVIAISGGNIAILAGILLVAFRGLGVDRRVVAIGTVVVLGGYASLVGSEASVARATLAAAVMLTARAVDHRPVPLNTLALVGLGLVGVRPSLIVDAGFQLTFGATLGILVGVPRVERAVRAVWSGPRPRVASVLLIPVTLLAATVSAELVLFPVAALVFGRVSAAGLILNFAAIPLMTVTQVAGMTAVGAAGAASFVSRAAGWVAHGAAMGILESGRLVDVAPWLVARVPPPPWLLVGAYYGALITAFGCRRWRAPAVGVAAASAVLIVWAPVFPEGAARRGTRCGAGLLEVTFLDVGQADATVVRFPGGRSLLVDAGGSVNGRLDIGGRVVTPALWALGLRRLDYLVVSHADPDHVGGASAVIDDLRPREVWEGVPVPSSVVLAGLRRHASRRGAVWRTVEGGDTLRIGGVRVDVRHPPRPDWERPRVRNDDSVVLDIQYGALSVVLPGDIGTEIERALVDEFPPAAIRVLKVPHHGSRSSSSAPFLEALQPAVAVVSAGAVNPFGHPHDEVVERYAAVGATLLHTGEDGAVTVCSDGARVVVRTSTGRQRLFTAPT